MSKRNINEEIKKLKERNEFENGLISYKRLHFAIDLLKEKTDSFSSEYIEFFNYLPIVSVASIESFFRTTTKNLIDNKQQDVSVFSKLLVQGVPKIDVEFLYYLQDKQLTVGEFVSHILPCSNLNDLIYPISLLIGDDFFDSLKKHVPLSHSSEKNELNEKFVKEFNIIIKSIKDVFELRHILCHESASNLHIDTKKNLIDAENCMFFLEFSSDFVCSLIYENWGEAPSEKIAILYSEYRGLQAKFEQLYQSNLSRRIDLNESEKTAEHFANFKKSFKSYAKSKAILKSSYSPSAIWSEYIYVEDLVKSFNAIINDSVFEKE